MLDTNTISHLLKGHSEVAKQLAAKPIAAVCISVITEGELRFGLAKRPEAKHLQQVVSEFIRHIDVLPWDSQVAELYGVTRAQMERQGKNLASLDLLIATHALSVGAVLVTNDQAFFQVASLPIDDWTKPE